MSLVSASQVKALVKTTADDYDVQDVIDREESYLAHELGAPIAGARTQQVWRYAFGLGPANERSFMPFLPFGSSDWRPIFLMRPTDMIDELRDNGVVIDADDIRLLGSGTVIERAGNPWTGPLIEVDYTPNDALQVARVVIELCRLTFAETAYNAENLGEYSYQRAGIKPATAMQIQNASRRALVRTLLVKPTSASTRLSAGSWERVSA